MSLRVRTFVIQSVSEESLSFSEARFLTVFGMTKEAFGMTKGGYLHPFAPICEICVRSFVIQSKAKNLFPLLLA